MCKTIKHKVKFKASPAEVFKLLTDSKVQSSFTGKKAVLPKKIGAKFSCAGGFVTGVIVDLSPGQRVVQAWRDADFPPGIFSMAAFQLKKIGEGETELVLTHRGVPKELIPGVEQFWRNSYWQKMRTYLSK